MATLMAGCVSSRPQPQPVAMAPAAGATKQILRDGGQLVLPDGTRVRDRTRPAASCCPMAIMSGATAAGLILPTGARCAPSAGGYLCP